LQAKGEGCRERVEDSRETSEVSVVPQLFSMALYNLDELYHGVSMLGVKTRLTHLFLATVDFQLFPYDVQHRTSKKSYGRLAEKAVEVVKWTKRPFRH